MKMKKGQQHGGKLAIGTFAVLAVILAVLFGVYMYMRHKREGFESQVIVRYYYLPTCGWCQKFKPEWDAFSKNIQDDQKLKPKLRMVKLEEIDGSKQDVPVQGFPTVHLVDTSGKVSEYKGDRTATALMDAVLPLLG